MKSFALFLLTLLLIPAAQAIVNAGLPTPARSEQPGLLLELGQEPAALTVDPASLRVVGAVSNHAGDSAIRIDKDEINVLHPGFGHWQVSFRFQLPPGFAEQNYRFWTRWRQGGEPDVCVQNFEIWADTDPGKLEQRGVFSLNPKGWEPAWLAKQRLPSNLRTPVAAGHMLQPKAVPGETAQPLQHGRPAAWLVGGLMDGQAGLAAYGLDSETVLRPNPDQAYVSLQMMGGTMRTWQIAASQTDGTTDVAANTQHNYGWSRGSGYAQLYLHTEQTTQAWLHLQHSGIKTAAWLDGQALPLEQDSQPPSHSVSPIERAKNLLHGLTTEGLLATATAEHPALPQVGVLNLSPGWHSLLVKMVMQHDAGQRFFFSGILTDTTGQPLDNITTQTSDPNADLALNRIAAQLRPWLFVDAPANLPHPGEPLKLRVDLR